MMAQALTSSATSTFAGRQLRTKAVASRPAARAGLVVKAAKQTTVIGFKEKGFRNKNTGEQKDAPLLLARVEQLRLLSKVEEAGLLTVAEKAGLSLSGIEKAGLLSTAENLGLIAAAGNRGTPGALTAAAFALFATAPALVYVLPEDNAGLVAAQVLAVLVCAGGGAAALGGAKLLSSLQK